MPNTNTRWYRLLVNPNGQDRATCAQHIINHLPAIPNINSSTTIPTLVSQDSTWVYGDLIVSVIMSGSKATDDQAMYDLGAHLETVHNYLVIVTVVPSDQVYP